MAIRDGINTFEPVSKMLLPFLAIIGQIERQNTGERVRCDDRTFTIKADARESAAGWATVKEGKLSKLVSRRQDSSVA